jgi:UDP-2,3-diacylglucosamine pyrophosphatase LpxH
MNAPNRTFPARTENPHRYRAVWISDVHLGTRDSQAEYVLSLLRHVQTEYLYVIGDLIDIWQLRRRWYWPQTFNTVIQKLLRASRKGIRVIYIPGNHDETFRNFRGHHFGGVEIHDRVIHRTAKGARLLVLHGHEFDMVVQCHRWLALFGSAAYDYLITANRILNVVRRRLGLPYWSFSGYVKRRVKNAVSFIRKFENVVANAARRNRVEGVVCGHIHQPTIKRVDGVLYCNTGDWVENCTALVETFEGELKLLDWLKEAPVPFKEEVLEPDGEDVEPVEMGIEPVEIEADRSSPASFEGIR